MENSNQPAFPLVAGDQSNPDDRLLCEGLTKREYFAGLAMQGYLASYPADTNISPESCAKKAVQLADSLLTALTSTPLK